MRTISPLQLVLFFTVVGLMGLLAFLAVTGLRGMAGLGSELLTAGLFVLLFYTGLFGAYRLLLAFFPLPVGAIEENSRDEFVYHVYLLFLLFFFYPLMRSGLVPVPLMRLVYLLLGARLGANTYSSGIIFDPHFVTIGANTLVGQGALIIPHAIEGRGLAMFPVRIGSNATIGANAVILPDVEIGDGAIVAVGAVVTKGSRIGPGEVWGGVPARLLKTGKAPSS